jgi:hypothetical protein
MDFGFVLSRICNSSEGTDKAELRFQLEYNFIMMT